MNVRLEPDETLRCITANRGGNETFVGVSYVEV